MTISYLMGSSPVWFFVDNTGMIAVGATMGTFEADNHALQKAVYENSDGSGPYTNPVDLDVVGIAPIYFANDSAYYLEIYDADGNILHTVDDYSPDNGGGNSTTINDAINYLVNPQFQFNYGTQTGTDIGTSTPLPIAQAGWSFSKNGTQAVDTISFPLFALGDSVPEGTPVQYLHAVCSNSGINETYRYYQFFMPNVRIFEQQQVIGTLAARSSSNSVIAIIVTQFFGTGGSPSADVDNLLGDGITLTGTWANYSAAGTLASVVGKTLGTNGDDGVWFRVLAPLNTTYHLDLTNMAFRLGSVIFPFPVDSFNLDRDLTMGSQIPVPDNGISGKDIGSSLTVKEYGLEWTRVFAPGLMLPWVGSKSNIPSNFTYCDGARYDSTLTFSDGVDTAGLFNELGIRFGNGADYLFPIFLGGTAILNIMNNAAGAVAPIAGGTPAPSGFTYTAKVTGNSGYNIGKVYYDAYSRYVGIWTNINCAVYPSTSTTGIAITTYNASNTVTDGVYIVNFDATSALNNQYWYFDAPTIKYYVWYDYISTGTDPAPMGFTGIKVSVDISDDVSDVMFKTVASIRGAQLTYVTASAGSVIVGGTYFTAAASGVNIAVWYSVDTVGTAPVLGGYTIIEVPILSTDSAITVASKTSAAVSTRFFQVPDGRGAFITGLPDGSGIDPGVANRFSLYNPINYGDSMGTYQFDSNRSHAHDITFGPGGGGPTGRLVPGDEIDGTSQTEIEGQARSTPYNFAAYWIIAH